MKTNYNIIQKSTNSGSHTWLLSFRFQHIFFRKIPGHSRLFN